MALPGSPPTFRISYTFADRTRPRSVKKHHEDLARGTKEVLDEILLLVFIPDLPLPPCAGRYWDTAGRLI